MLNLIVHNIIIYVIILFSSLLPSNYENLIVDTSAINSQSVEMVFEYENKTGRVVDRPTVLEISEKTEDGWNSFFENPAVIEEPQYDLPGGNGTIRIPVEYYYGEPTLSPGEYKVKITYRVHESNDKVSYTTIEVPFIVE